MYAKIQLNRVLENMVIVGKDDELCGYTLVVGLLNVTITSENSHGLYHGYIAKTCLARWSCCPLCRGSGDMSTRQYRQYG